MERFFLGFSAFSREKYDKFTRRQIQDLSPHIRRDIGWYD